MDTTKLQKWAEEAAQNNICLNIQELFAFLRYKAKCKSEKSGSKFPVSDMEIDIKAIEETKQSRYEITLRDKGCESNISYCGNLRKESMYRDRVEMLTSQGEDLEVIQIERFGKSSSYKYLVCTWTYTKE